MDDVRVAGGPAGGARVRREEERHEQHLPRAPLQVPDDPVAVREPEVSERRRRDDDDLDATRAHVLDGVAHEGARDVVPGARVRRREDDDLHAERARAATTASAAASVAKT